MAHILLIIYLFLNILSPHRWSGEPSFSPDQIIAIFALIFSYFGANRPAAVTGYKAQVTMAILFFVWFVISASKAGSDVIAIEYAYKGFLLYIIASLAIQQAEHLNRVLVAFAIIAVIISLNGILTIEFDSGFVPLDLSWGYRLNWIQQYDDSNTTAILLCIAASILFVLLLSVQSSIYKLASLACLGIVLFAIKLTDSRAGILELMGSIFIVLMMRYSFKKAMLYSSPLILVGLAIVSTRMLSLNTEDQSAQNRMVFWARGLEILRENPIFGVGFRGFDKIVGKQAHNTVVQVSAESGFIGYVLWFAMFYIGAKALLATWKKSQESEALKDLKPSILMLFGGSVTLIIGGWFNTIYNDLIYIWLGICMATYRIAHEKDKSVEITVNTKDFMYIGLFSAMGLVLVRVFVQKYI